MKKKYLLTKKLLSALVFSTMLTSMAPGMSMMVEATQIGTVAEPENVAQNMPINGKENVADATKEAADIVEVESEAYTINITPAVLVTEDNYDDLQLDAKYIGYYAIADAGQLYWFAGLVNGTLETEAQNVNACAVLTGDIVVNTDVIDSNGELVTGVEFAEWTPVGCQGRITAVFGGTFDGSGHKISGLYNDGIGSYEGREYGENYIGLFGKVSSTATIKNVGVTDTYFTTNLSAAYLSGICGSNEGIIDNCYSEATLYSQGYHVGGICGYSEAGDISNCHNDGKITNQTQSNTGGICGYALKTNFTNCYNTGKITGVSNTGGICGYIYNNSTTRGSFANCHNTGDIMVTDGMCGGIVGSLSYADISNCHNTGNINSKKYDVGGIAGYASDATVSDCYNTGNVTASEEGEYPDNKYVGGIIGYANNYNITKCHNTAVIIGGYRVAGIAGSCYNGTVSDCYNTGSITATHKDGEAGGITGNGYSTSDIITDTYNSGKINGTQYVGGIAGRLNAVIVEESYNTGKVVATGNYAGGISGESYRSDILNCYNTADVTGANYVGGILGYAYNDDFGNCYSIGKIQGTNTGDRYCVGGIGGCIPDVATVFNCYYLKDGVLRGSGEVSGFYEDIISDGTGVMEAMSVDQFVMGEVAYRLSQGCIIDDKFYSGSVWGQIIGTHESPVLIGNTIYRTDTQYCDGATGGYFYSNDENEGGIAHYLVDGVCTNCGQYRNDLDADLTGHSLTLGAKIAVNFGVYLGESVLNDEKAYVEMTYPDGSKTKVMISDVKDNPIYKDTSASGEGRYIFTCEVAAKEMESVVSLQVIGSNMSSSAVWNYTVKEYADDILAEDSGYDETTKDLVESMVDYGKYTLKYFSGDTESNEKPADVNAEELNDYKGSATINNRTGIKYYGSSLILESTIKVRHYFTADETVTENDIKLAGLTKSGNYYYIDGEGAAVNDFATKKVYEIAGNRIEYCTLSYIQSVLGSSDFDGNTPLRNVLKSLYNYYKAALEYSKNH